MTGNRVLLTCEDYLPCIGGAEMCVYHLKRELTALGYSVTVFTNTMSRTDDERGIVRCPWSFSPTGFFRNVAMLWRIIGRHDIVHSMYSFRLACICSVIAKIRRKPMLLTQQGKGIVPEAHPRFIDSLLVKVCQRVSMRLASHITSTSDEITELTAAFVPRAKITAVSNGYDARLLQPDPLLPVPPEFASLPQGVKRLLTVRRLVPKNGIHILVQALALVQRVTSDFHYVAIGEGRAAPFIRSLIEEFDLQGHVTLLGSRANDTLRPYYQHADLVLMPSSAEARSISCIEAMGMGKPIIASRVGGLIDLLRPDSSFGDLVTVYDSEACTYDPPQRLSEDRLKPLADAIIAFLRDPETLCAKGRKAMAFARGAYAWGVITKQYVQLYERLGLGRK
ncbi:MAG: glycosyltransferase family 4 protein [Candidatus Peribacteraceae bacterium]|nr:glycosyltransferase family 4 protein [Candidatus Peribacteraceae bacterium]